MIETINIADTPGLYEIDRRTLEWAAKLAGAGEDRADVAELAPEEPHAAHRYPAALGHARCNTRGLLDIIARLAEQARRDADTIATLRAERDGQAPA